MDKKLLILGLCGFIVMADNWVISPILPAISGSIGANVSSAGLLISAYMIPFGLFQLIFGPLADRFGKKLIINISMIVFAMATALCTIGSSLIDLGIYRALTGIFAASVMPTSLALIGDIYSMKERQSAIGTFMGISYLGQGMSMAIGGTIAYYLNWRAVFGMYALLAIFITALLMTTGRRIQSKGNPDSKLFSEYRNIFQKSSNIVLYVAILSEGILIIGSFSYLGSFLDNMFNVNYLMIGLIMTLFGFFAMVGGRISGKIATKIGRMKVLEAGLLLASCSDLMLFIYGYNMAVAMASISLLGLGFMFAQSSLLTLATEAVKNARGAAMSIVAFCFMGGGGVGTAIGGHIIKRSGFSGLFSLYGLLLLVLLFYVTLFLNGNAPEKVAA